MSQVTFWNALEYFCRLLGISTGAGIAHAENGPNQSNYVCTNNVEAPDREPESISGVAVSACEVAYFVSLLLAPCSTPKGGSRMDVCWKQARRRGAFQKFLAYLLLSIACFLHPVLVWHVTIPGTMLVLTGLAYFVLSKQQKETRANGEEQVRAAYDTAVSVMGIDDPGQTYMFCKAAERGRGSSFAGYLRNYFKGGKEQGAVLNPSSTLSVGKQRHFEDKVVDLILSVREDSEQPESLAEESTSDTAPILAPQL